MHLQLQLLDKQVTHKVFNFKSPLELLYKIKPYHQGLKVFGCLCFSYLRCYNTNKRSFKSVSMHFSGLCNKSERVKCLDTNNRIHISRHVVFNEQVFPSNKSEIKTTQKIYNPKYSLPSIPTQLDEIASDQQRQNMKITNVNSRWLQPRIKSWV